MKHLSREVMEKILQNLMDGDPIGAGIVYKDPDGVEISATENLKNLCTNGVPYYVYVPKVVINGVELNPPVKMSAKCASTTYYDGRDCVEVWGVNTPIWANREDARAYLNALQKPFEGI